MSLIAFNGAAGTGKDTLADVLVKHFGYTKLAFADPLKKILSKSFNIPLNEFYDRVKDKAYDWELPLLKRHIECVHEYLQDYIELDFDTGNVFNEHRFKCFSSHREIMQYVGTEILRSIEPDIWLKIFALEVKKHEKVACSDVRMPNERKLIKELEGTLVLITRPGCKPKNHASEADFGEESEYDVTVDNNTGKVAVEEEFKSWYIYTYDPRNKQR